MAKVTGQDRQHALFAALNEFIHTKEEEGYAQMRARTRSASPFSWLLDLWHRVLKWAVLTWRELTDEQKEYWHSIAPPQFRSGYTYFIFCWLMGASGAGPFTVGGLFPIGVGYVGLPISPYGVTGTWCVGHSMVGGSAAISRV